MKTEHTLSKPKFRGSSVVTKTLLFGASLVLAGQDSYSQCKSMIDVDFNNWNNNRVYSVADAKSDFGNIKPWSASTYRGIKAPGAASNLIGTVKQTTRVVDGTLRAHYTKNDAGGYAGGFLFDPYWDGVEEAYLEYKVKFDKNFLWKTGGKLPGLGGSTRGIGSESESRGAIPSGCKYNDDGFSARLMWRRNTSHTQTPYLILYSYFAKKYDKDGKATGNRVDGNCGDGVRIFTGLEDDKWYTIRQYIKLNTPGQSNGTVTIWINGVQTFKKTNMMIRRSGKSNLKINALVINTYRGGNRTDKHWQSPRDEYAFFDDFKVWTGCANPPNGNDAPVVAVTAPANNMSFTVGETIPLSATATDSDGSIKKVNFKVNDAFHSQDLTGPSYTGTFTPTSPGIYKISARAFDDKDLATEEEVTIIVNEQKGPFSDTPMSIPGVLQAENYDKGGQGVAYSDTDPENKGTAQTNFRTTQGVDIGTGNAGKVVGWTNTGEWTEYTVNVAETGAYNVILHYSARSEGSMLGLTMDGINLFPDIELPMTGDFGNYTTITRNLIELEAGEHELRMNVVKNGFNLDRIEFVRSDVTSINDFNEVSSIVIYPNPSHTGIFNLTHSTDWKLLSVQGLELAKGKGKQINVSEMKKGIYIVQLPHGVTKRVLIE